MASCVRYGATCLVWLGCLSIAPPDAAMAAQVKLVIEAVNPATDTVLQRHEQLLAVSDTGSFSIVQLTNGNDTWQFYEGSVAGRVDQPRLNSVFGLQNVRAFPVAFQVTFELGVGQNRPSTRIGGSTSGSFGEDSTFSSFGSLPFFTGQVDGVSMLALNAGPFSLAALPGEFAPIPSVSAGLPGGTMVSGPITQSIGVRNSFVLSGFSSMSVGNQFIVRPVPEPTSYFLLAMCLLLPRFRQW